MADVYRRMIGAGALVLLALLGFGQLTLPHYRIANPAMEPSLPQGATVFIRAQQHYASGDTVIIRAGTHVFARQLVSIDAAGKLTTTAGASSVPDALPLVNDHYRPLTVVDIEGKVVLTVRYFWLLFVLAVVALVFAFCWGMLSSRSDAPGPILIRLKTALQGLR